MALPPSVASLDMLAVMAEQSPEEYFAGRDYRIEFHVEDGHTWADLVHNTRKTRLRRRVKVRFYGMGTDESTAATRAMQRWKQEQGD